MVPFNSNTGRNNAAGRISVLENAVELERDPCVPTLDASRIMYALKRHNYPFGRLSDDERGRNIRCGISALGPTFVNY